MKGKATTFVNILVGLSAFATAPPTPRVVNDLRAIAQGLETDIRAFRTDRCLTFVMSDASQAFVERFKAKLLHDDLDAASHARRGLASIESAEGLHLRINTILETGEEADKALVNDFTSLSKGFKANLRALRVAPTKSALETLRAKIEIQPALKLAIDGATDQLDAANIPHTKTYADLRARIESARRDFWSSITPSGVTDALQSLADAVSSGVFLNAASSEEQLQTQLRATAESNRKAALALRETQAAGQEIPRRRQPSRKTTAHLTSLERKQSVADKDEKKRVREMMMRPFEVTPLHEKVFEAAEADYTKLLSSEISKEEFEIELAIVEELMNEAAQMGSSKAFARLGDISATLGNCESAASLYRASLQINEQASTWYKLSLMLAKGDEALACLKRANELEPYNGVYADKLLGTASLCASLGELSLE